MNYRRTVLHLPSLYIPLGCSTPPPLWLASVSQWAATHQSVTLTTGLPFSCHGYTVLATGLSSNCRGYTCHWTALHLPWFNLPLTGPHLPYLYLPLAALHMPWLHFLLGCPPPAKIIQYLALDCPLPAMVIHATALPSTCICYTCHWTGKRDKTII